jgi:hypothetical protein
MGKAFSYMLKLKRWVFIVLILPMLWACTGQHKKLNRIIEQADRVVVVLYDNPGSITGKTVFESTDPDRIKMFMKYFTKKRCSTDNRQFSGRITFYTGNKNTVIEYITQPEYQCVSYSLGYNLYTRQLSADGLEFLKLVTMDTQNQSQP